MAAAVRLELPEDIGAMVVWEIIKAKPLDLGHGVDVE